MEGGGREESNRGEHLPGMLLVLLLRLWLRRRCPLVVVVVFLQPHLRVGAASSAPMLLTRSSASSRDPLVRSPPIGINMLQNSEERHGVPQNRAKGAQLRASFIAVLELNLSGSAQVLK